MDFSTNSNVYGIIGFSNFDSTSAPNHNRHRTLAYYINFDNNIIS